jgi:hypothetical protein
MFSQYYLNTVICYKFRLYVILIHVQYNVHGKSAYVQCYSCHHNSVGFQVAATDFQQEIYLHNRLKVTIGGSYWIGGSAILYNFQPVE